MPKGGKQKMQKPKKEVKAKKEKKVKKEVSRTKARWF
jgi:hypothetical protein